MSKINTERLEMLLGELRQARGKLQAIAQKPEATVLSSAADTDIMKYNLIIAIQAAIDICYHIVAKEGGRAPQGYGDCFKILGEREIISLPFAQKLGRMAKFRNLLVHLYGEVDDQRVYRIMREDLSDLEKFEARLGSFLAKNI